MANLTTKHFWTSLGRGVSEKKKTSDMEFRPIFEEYLKPKKGEVLEIGCVPGNFLVYLNKRFGYSPVGIDFDEKTKEILSRTFLNAGIKKFEIFQKDFNKWKTDRKFDLVCSFGFIEHFDNAGEIVRKHIDLMKRKGTLVIEIPNFSGIPGFFHKLIDKPNLEKHNTSIMNLDFFRKIAEENKMEIIYLGYYGSFHFQWGYGRRKTANIFQKGVYAILKIISKITVNFPMRNKLSNYIVFIAKRK